LWVVLDFLKIDRPFEQLKNLLKSQEVSTVIVSNVRVHKQEKGAQDTPEEKGTQDIPAPFSKVKLLIGLELLYIPTSALN